MKINEILDYDVYSLPLWGMKQKDMQSEFISKYDTIITIEDHLIDGGFGSWMLESAANNPKQRSKIKSFGLSSKVCGMVGSQDSLMDSCLDLSELLFD